MILNLDDFRKALLGCWMGKNIGGTLGAPMEWRRQINDVSFYTQELGGEPLPNDDLDIQLLWVVALEEQGVAIDAKTLGEYWLLYVTPHWAEYGFAKINMRAGLLPPLSGSANNEYKHSCGAFIRSEVWACIAPGCPAVAARYAYEDAILDHGDGEGTYAATFCAAIESAAFVEKDIRSLIEIALSYVPGESGVAGAVANAIASYDAGKTWREARDELLTHYRGKCHMGLRFCISDEDFDKGFYEGKLGWDAPSNIGIIILGLLYGEGDFDKTLCIAVNCGEDTDCTGATVGALFGILHGIDSINEKWIKPIGRSIKTGCLNLGELGYFGNQLPLTVDNLTDRTISLTHQTIAYHHLPVTLAPHAKTDLADVSADTLKAGADMAGLYANMGGPVFQFDFFTVGVDYDGDPTVCDGEPKTICLRIENTYKTSALMKIHWYAPKGWKVSPSPDGVVDVKQAPFANVQTVEFTVKAKRVREPLTRFAVELTIDGHPTVMLVPVALLNGTLTSASA